eukprot:403336221
MESDTKSLTSSNTKKSKQSSATATTKDKDKKSKKKSSKSDKKDNLEEDLKILKLQKKALKKSRKEEQTKNIQLEAENAKLKSQNSELEAELKSKEQKYLDFYMENSHQHEQIIQLQNQIQLLEQSLQKYDKPVKDQSSKDKSGRLRDDSDMIMNYEKRIQEMMMNMQKLERDLSYKEEELKNIKNIARDTAAELEPMKKMEMEYKQILEARDATIDEKVLEIRDLKQQIITQQQEAEDKLHRVVKDMEAANKKVLREIEMTNQHTNQLTDLRLDFEAKIEKKDKELFELMEILQKLKDDIKGKDQAIRALSDTLLEKGEENQRLSEAVNEIKNHHLTTSVLGQKFSAQKIGTIKYDDVILRFMYDSSREDCEYFLDISDSRGKSWKQISVIDIDSIEPDQGIKFILSYYVSNKFFGKSETIKQEFYQSRHIAELKDAYDQILSIMDKKEEEVEKFVQSQRSQSMMIGDYTGLNSINPGNNGTQQNKFLSAASNGMQGLIGTFFKSKVEKDKQAQQQDDKRNIQNRQLNHDRRDDSDDDIDEEDQEEEDDITSDEDSSDEEVIARRQRNSNRFNVVD